MSYVDWEGDRKNPITTGKIVVIKDRPCKTVERQKAFDLYKVFPDVAEYREAIRVLTKAGLLKRFPDKDVSLHDLSWDETYGWIRIER